MALDARARAALVVLPLLVAGYVLSRVDLAIALLALALYGRCAMKPAQVERISNAVGPIITNTVRCGCWWLPMARALATTTSNCSSGDTPLAVALVTRVA
jgi:hypothetical protein